MRTEDMVTLDDAKKGIAASYMSLLDIIEKIQADGGTLAGSSLSKALKEKIKEFDDYMASDELYTMSEAAKLLGFGRNRAFKTLREEGDLLTDVLTSNKILLTHNDPNQNCINNGYFKVVQAKRERGGNKIIKVDVTSLQKNKTEKRTRTQTLITPKGLSYIRKLFRSYGLITDKDIYTLSIKEYEKDKKGEK